MKVILRIRKLLGWILKDIRRIIKKMPNSTKRLIIVSLLTLVVGCVLGTIVGHAVEKKRSEKKVATAVAKVQTEEKKKLDAAKKELYDLKDEMNTTEEELPWNLVLVNSAHPMEQGYVPELVEFEEGYSIDARIADATKKMLADAKEAGMNIKICSAYRSVERQKQVFSESMAERVRTGMTYWDAYRETSVNVAEPGTSEHALGLALDLISNQYTELDERQEDTKEAKWLKENCYKYGFILRYPPEKTSITGIIYEPWHYRYVGEEDAKKIMELGVTLEEYLQDHYQAKGEE